LAVGLAGTGFVHAQAPTASAPEASLLAAATAEKDAVVRTLERLVNVESGSTDAQGLAQMADLLEGELRALGAQVTRHKPADGGPGANIVGRINGKGQRRILLIAHMDTVYPRGTLARMPFRVEGDRAYGPGVADAKGGIAVILHALRLLGARGFDDFASIGVLFNTDEERSSPGSSALIEAVAREHDVVLSFEPTTSPREIMVRATSGVANVRVTVKGRPAHAGVNPEAGVNAMVEAADFMLRNLDLDQPARAFRFTWTIGTGGTVANVVPAQAMVQANIRYIHEADLQAALSTLRQRAAQPRLAGAELSVELSINRPSFVAGPAGEALIEKARAIYAQVGGSISVIPSTGGGTDAAFAARSGRPVLEGLGLPGFGYHSDQAEYAQLDAIPRRLYLAARLITDLARGQ
jgi:glutamate carboxypeptidase